ncbi:MAG: hypothetical protein AAFU79_02035 [Myxococcota bacterium]
MSVNWTDLLHFFINHLLELILSGVSIYLAPVLKSFVSEKVENDFVAGAMNRAINAIQGAVAGIHAEYDRMIAEGRLETSEMGSVLTSTEADRAVQAAVDRAKRALGDNGIAALLYAFTGDTSSMEEWLRGEVQKQLVGLAIKAPSISAVEIPGEEDEGEPEVPVAPLV